MFSTTSNVKSTLLCGPAELSKSFMFEAAIYWAEEGHRVVYITPAPLDSLPAACHDRSNPAPAAFKLMRFMYLENYEALVQKLTELHTFAILPSILLIDDMDAYIKDYGKTESMHDMHIAKTCALILDTMNSCSRILKNTVYACVWSTLATSDMRIYSMYFADAWIATNEEETKTILLEQHGHRSSSGKPTSYRYCKLQDGSRALKEIFC
ncbi:uncharacterized protein LOC143217488 [Lasioglossum baleicum]|uniref:uncharacterized protein LOC143217488 n=1 Tax=Lasioglossum baleicum TaxID=434251 RepID=UPI003FCDF6D8